MQKLKDAVRREKVIAIVRGVEPEQITDTARALYDGGIRLMEITYQADAPELDARTAEQIRRVARQFEGRMFIGAGTVLTLEQAERTADAGGSFIISPDVSPAVIEKACALHLAAIPGAMTPTEMQTAHLAGAAFVKVFPAGVLGPEYFRAVLAPMKHIELLAVGGVDRSNLASYLRAGACGAGIGGSLVRPAAVREGRFAEITAAARELTGIAAAFGKQDQSK